MSVLVHADDLAKELRQFGRLPKLFTVKACDYGMDKERRKVNHSLVTLRTADTAVTVVYDTLRKCLESLSKQSVNIEVDEDGLSVDYGRGTLFLKHLEEHPDAARLQIGECER